MTDDAVRLVILTLLQVAFLRSVIIKDLVHGVGHSSVCQIMMQIVLRAVITSSPPAWTSSAGSCRLQLTSLSSMIVLQAPLLCEGLSGHPLCLSGESSVPMDLYWLCLQLRAVFCPSVQYLFSIEPSSKHGRLPQLCPHKLSI